MNRLEESEAATAWRTKAIRWLDRATANPADPEVLGTLSNTMDRMMFPKELQISLMAEIPLHSDRMKRFRPTWRQLLELEILRAEAEGPSGRPGPRDRPESP